MAKLFKRIILPILFFILRNYFHIIFEIRNIIREYNYEKKISQKFPNPKNSVPRLEILR